MDLASKSEELRQIRRLIEGGEHQEARRRLRRVAHPGDPLSLQMKFYTLWGMLAPDPTAKVIRVALIATSSVEHLAQVWQFWLAQQGLQPEIYVAPFGVYPQEILHPNSALYQHQPDLVWILEGHRDVKVVPHIGDSAETVEHLVAEHISTRIHHWNLLRDRLGCEVLVCNADLPADRTLGNLESQVEWSRESVLRRYNSLLPRQAPRGVIVMDLDHVASCYGRRLWHDPRFWYHSRHTFALDAIGEVASTAAHLVGAVRGLSRKVLVLDLDNTLWGGIIGDDGLGGIQLGEGPDGEAFVDFQRWIKRLRERGVVLAISSKNAEVNAREPFQNHPAMILRESDLAAFKADWRDKATHLREIASELGLGLDSFVFVDDNPAERALIRSELPQVAVPELPPDPARYIDTLSRGNYFEMIHLSHEDRLRADAYAANFERRSLQQSTSDLPTFLTALQMMATVGELSDKTLARVSQLINKSNQFHLTTTRYSESKLLQRIGEGTLCRWIQLKDLYGDHGLISVILAIPHDGVLLIDTWVMSCRVLSRGVEHLMLSVLVELAHSRGLSKLRGQYKPTPRNGLVAELYPSLGFEKLSEDDEGTWWELDLTTWVQTQPIYISCKRGDP